MIWSATWRGHQSASSHKGSAVFEHRLDLCHGRVVGLQSLDRSQGRLGQQRPRRGDRVDGVGLFEPPAAALRGGTGAAYRCLFTDP